MKNTLLLLILTFSSFQVFAQSKTKPIEKSVLKDSVAVQYRLFPTTNIWTFIKLNTSTGQMWQVQFSMDEDTRFVTTLSSDSLVSANKAVNGRFTLYPTQNMFTFILLDQIDGRTWQVQWSTDFLKRGIFPIE